MPAWVWWLIAAGALAVGELVSFGLVLVMFSGGAVAAAVAAGLDVPVVVQALVFGLVSILLLFVVRPFLHHRVISPTQTRTGVAALEGAPALVLESVDAHSGLIKVGGEVWTARSYDPTQVLETGDHVTVMEIQGATALVWRQP